MEGDKIEVITMTQFSSHPTPPVESELEFVDVFLVSSDCSGQGGTMTTSAGLPLSTEVIPFDGNSLTKTRIPSDIPF